MQLVLLRVATEGSFEPIGGMETLTTNTRLITGSHCDLPVAVAEGEFRSDLYYALSTTELSLTPLRARMEDLDILSRHILGDLASEHSKPVEGLPKLALEFLGN